MERKKTDKHREKALVALVADLFPAARLAGGERESRWRTATIFSIIGVANPPLPLQPPPPCTQKCGRVFGIFG